MLFSTNQTYSDPEFIFKGEVIKPAHACRYLGEKIDSNTTFENWGIKFFFRQKFDHFSLTSSRIVSCQPNCLSQNLA